MKSVDAFSERILRRIAKTTSRRGFLGSIGLAMTGAAAVPAPASAIFLTI